MLSQSSTTEPHPQPKTLISETQFSDTFYLLLSVVWISLNSKEDTQTLFFIEFISLLF